MNNDEVQLKCSNAIGHHGGKWTSSRTLKLNPSIFCRMACDKNSSEFWDIPKFLSYEKASEKFRATNVFQRFSLMPTIEVRLLPLACIPETSCAPNSFTRSQVLHTL